MCVRKGGWAPIAPSHAQLQLQGKFAPSVACAYSLKLVIEPSVNARMDLWAVAALKFALKQMMVAYAVDMGSVWHTAILQSANATRTSLEAPAPRAALGMPMALFAMAMASVS